MAATLMCGIVATVGLDPALVTARGANALRVIAHRGPDDEGTWTDGSAWLGHRRLAVIDLTPGGHQPMIDEASGLVITFNGEIYNYIELRAELAATGYRFKTESDTEVLLAAYLTWGEACLGRLNGMWAFLIWDPRNRRAFIARDRLGVKPLYFALTGGGLAVASEPKALLELSPSLRRVDGGALYDFLAKGKLYTGEASFYAGVQVLEPGSCGTYDLGARSVAGRTTVGRPPSVRYRRDRRRRPVGSHGPRRPMDAVGRIVNIDSQQRPCFDRVASRSLTPLGTLVASSVGTACPRPSDWLGNPGRREASRC